MKIKPLDNKVLVKPKETESKTEGGIYIPDSAKDEKIKQGKVVEVGKCEKCPIEKGDDVIFESFSGTEIKIDGVKYLIMNIKDIRCNCCNRKYF